MKGLKFILPVVLSCTVISYSAKAQETKKERKAAKQAVIKAAIDNHDFVFTAEYAQPLRGGNIYIASVYDMKVRKDSLITYLPYYGVAFVAPIDPLNGGIKFTSTKFSYVTQLKKSGYQVVIKPTDTQDVRQMILDVTPDGYSTLSITNRDRDPIRFSGYVEAAANAKDN